MKQGIFSAANKTMHRTSDNITSLTDKPSQLILAPPLPQLAGNITRNILRSEKVFNKTLLGTIGE